MEAFQTKTEQSIRALELEAESLKGLIDQRKSWLNNPDNFEKPNYTLLKNDTSNMEGNYNTIINKIKELNNQKDEQTGH